MPTILNNINHLRSPNGLNPKSATALRVLIVTDLWLQNAPSVPTGSHAAAIADVSRPLIDAGRIVIESQDKALITAVLAGRVSLTAAAAKARRHVRLVDSFKAASLADRAAFAQAIGPNELFDSTISPAL